MWFEYEKKKMQVDYSRMKRSGHVYATSPKKRNRIPQSAL